MRRSRILFVISLVLMDAAMSLLAFYIAYLIRALDAGLRDRPLQRLPVAGRHPVGQHPPGLLLLQVLPPAPRCAC